MRKLFRSLNARRSRYPSALRQHQRSLIGRAVVRFGMPAHLGDPRDRAGPRLGGPCLTWPRSGNTAGASAASPATARSRGWHRPTSGLRRCAASFEALEGDCIVREPRKILKQTIAIWNLCQRRAAEAWPRARLASPFKGDPYMLPLTRLPGELPGGTWRAWETRMSHAGSARSRCRRFGRFGRRQSRAYRVHIPSPCIRPCPA